MADVLTVEVRSRLAKARTDAGLIKTMVETPLPILRALRRLAHTGQAPCCQARL